MKFHMKIIDVAENGSVNKRDHAKPGKATREHLVRQEDLVSAPKRRSEARYGGIDDDGELEGSKRE